MKGRRDILIVHMVDHTPGGLPDLLHRNGFGTRLLNEVREAGTVLRTLERPIVLARCGSDERATVKSVKDLIRNKALHDYPLIIVGKNADAIEGIAENYFETVATLCTPCENSEILDCILFVNNLEKAEAVNPEGKGASLSADSTAASDSHERDRDAGITAVAAPAFLRERVTATQDRAVKPNHSSDIFRQVEALGFDRRSFDAEDFVEIHSLDQIKERGYLPSKAQVRAYAEGLLEELNDRSTAHLCRTNFITSNIGGALALESEMLECSKAAAFLCALAVADSDNQELLEVNYLLPDDKGNREKISEHMQTSARLVRDSLNEPLIADIIETMGQLIGKVKVDVDEELFFAASLLVASDLVERVCFKRSCWYPRGAHFIMRKARSGELLDLHPVVVGCVVRFVTEAVGSLPGVFVVPKMKVADKMLQARAAAEATYEPGEGEKKIPITALEPGMILARSLYAYDGRLVLEAGLRLDRDLIWRIWQLAAIRLLNTPCTVANDMPVGETAETRFDSGGFEIST